MHPADPCTLPGEIKKPDAGDVPWGQEAEKSVMHPGSIPPGYIENTLLARQVYPGIRAEKSWSG